MRFYSSTYLLLVFVICSSCKHDRIDIRFWKQGVKAKYLVSYGEYTFENNTYVPLKKVWYETELTILQKGKVNEIEWQQYFPISKKDNQTNFEKLQGDTINYMNGVKARFYLSEYGGIEKVGNWNDIENYLDSMIIAISFKEKLKNPDFKSDEMVQILNCFIKNHEAIENKTLKEFYIFHSIYGKEFSSKDSISIIDIDFGGRQIKEKVEYFPTKDGYYYMQITKRVEKFNNDSLMSFLLMDLNPGSSLNTDLSNVSYNITDTCKVIFNRNTCLPERLRFWRWTEFDTIRHISQYDIKLK